MVQLILKNLQILLDYYSSIGERFDLFHSVEKGTFVTGSIKHVAEALTSIINDLNLQVENKTFLDAGSGDGRVCAIASLLGLKSYGIEYNDLITADSQENIAKLLAQGLFTDSKPVIVQGDIFDDESYKKLGLEFKDINIIFNFVTYHEDLVEKIATESASGTVFILHSPCPISFRPTKLEFISEIPLVGIYQVMYVYKKP